MTDDVSTHSAYYPCACADERCDGWDSDPCDCAANSDHDLGQEIRDA